MAIQHCQIYWQQNDERPTDFQVEVVEILKSAEKSEVDKSRKKVDFKFELIRLEKS